MAEGPGVCHRLFPCAAHLQDDVDDVGHVVERSVGPGRPFRRYPIDSILIDRGRRLL